MLSILRTCIGRGLRVRVSPSIFRLFRPSDFRVATLTGEWRASRDNRYRPRSISPEYLGQKASPSAPLASKGRGRGREYRAKEIRRFGSRNRHSDSPGSPRPPLLSLLPPLDHFITVRFYCYATCRRSIVVRGRSNDRRGIEAIAKLRVSRFPRKLLRERSFHSRERELSSRHDDRAQVARNRAFLRVNKLGRSCTTVHENIKFDAESPEFGGGSTNGSSRISNTVPGVRNGRNDRFDERVAGVRKGCSFKL